MLLFIIHGWPNFHRNYPPRVIVNMKNSVRSFVFGISKRCSESGSSCMDRRSENTESYQPLITLLIEIYFFEPNASNIFSLEKIGGILFRYRNSFLGLHAKYLQQVYPNENWIAWIITG